MGQLSRLFPSTPSSSLKTHQLHRPSMPLRIPTALAKLRLPRESSTPQQLLQIRRRNPIHPIPHPHPLPQSQSQLRLPLIIRKLPRTFPSLSIKKIPTSSITTTQTTATTTTAAAAAAPVPRLRSSSCSLQPILPHRNFSNRHYVARSSERLFTSSSAAMSSFPPASHPSAACCSIPPVVSTGYQEKGSYEEVGGLKSCASLFPPPPNRG